MALQLGSSWFIATSFQNFSDLHNPVHICKYLFFLLFNHCVWIEYFDSADKILINVLFFLLLVTEKLCWKMFGRKHIWNPCKKLPKPEKLHQKVLLSRGWSSNNHVPLRCHSKSSLSCQTTWKAFSWGWQCWRQHKKKKKSLNAYHFHRLVAYHRSTVKSCTA